MAARTVLVVNPNSNASVTRGLEAALAGWQGIRGLAVECVTLADGPFGIETAEDIAAVEPLIEACVRERSDCAAFVIACYSDPGLERARSATSRPVFGMQQSAAAAAIARGGRFGVLALSAASIERHRVYLRRLGLDGQLAAELPLGVSVDGAANDPSVGRRIVEQGRRLVQEHGAASVVLGCAGLARHRGAAEEAIGVPVIEPVQAAVGFAVAALVDEP